jgi:hypothetical protein
MEMRILGVTKAMWSRVPGVWCTQARMRKDMPRAPQPIRNEEEKPEQA